MGIVPFIPNIKSRWFSFYTLIFTNYFVCCSYLANTYNVLAIIFWLYTSRFNPTREFQPFTTNVLPILGKGQSVVVPPRISFPETVKSSINSLCLHSLACIRWFPLTFFLFLKMILSQQSIFPKVARRDTKFRSFPPSTKPHPLFLFNRGPCLPCIGWVAGWRAPSFATLISSFSLAFFSFTYDFV